VQAVKYNIIHFSQWLYPYLGEIALAIMATLLVIYGDSINHMVKKQTIGLHFILRTAAFIILCTFGYGALLIFFAPILGKWLATIGMIYLGPFIVGVFITLGVIAERKNQI
jgi:hypothetical protein